MMELEFLRSPVKTASGLITGERKTEVVLKFRNKERKYKTCGSAKEDIAHYSKGTSEIWYKWPFMGFGSLKELQIEEITIYHSTQNFLGKNYSTMMRRIKRFIPYAIEPSVGVGGNPGISNRLVLRRKSFGRFRTRKSCFKTSSKTFPNKGCSISSPCKQITSCKNGTRCLS